MLIAKYGYLLSVARADAPAAYVDKRMLAALEAWDSIARDYKKRGFRAYMKTCARVLGSESHFESPTLVNHVLVMVCGRTNERDEAWRGKWWFGLRSSPRHNA